MQVSKQFAAARAAVRLALVAAAGSHAGAAHAAGTAAGTSITSIATASYVDENSAAQSVSSNSATIRVEEVLDISLSPIGAQPVSVMPGATEYAVSYRVTNVGNGPEPIDLAVATALGGDAFDPALVRIAVDRDNDGIYSPLVDTVYAPGSEPVLAPDTSIDVFVFVNLPGTVANGDEGELSLSARALTGSGAPGTLFAGVGSGGSDAMVGNTGAKATANGRLLVTTNRPTLAKSQSFEGARPVAGSVVTYTLAADLAGSSVTSPRIVDAIPAGTTYVPGSLTLGGSPLSDAVDSDAGSFSGSAIDVALSSSAAGPQVITFQVRVN